jgi:hypothetical protein
MPAWSSGLNGVRIILSTWLEANHVAVRRLLVIAADAGR